PPLRRTGGIADCSALGDSGTDLRHRGRDRSHRHALPHIWVVALGRKPRAGIVQRQPSAGATGVRSAPTTRAGNEAPSWLGPGLRPAVESRSAQAGRVSRSVGSRGGWVVGGGVAAPVPGRSAATRVPPGGAFACPDACFDGASFSMPTYRGGRHEHGQNFLTDHTTIDRLSRLVGDSTGPIVEIGPGQGRLTRELQKLGRSLTAVEIDSRLADRLASASQFREQKHVTVVNADFLHWPLPTTPYVVVGNVPFHLTTAILRRLLHDGAWTQVVLLVQWEVARR